MIGLCEKFLEASEVLGKKSSTVRVKRLRAQLMQSLLLAPPEVVHASLALNSRSSVRDSSSSVFASNAISHTGVKVTAQVATIDQALVSNGQDSKAASLAETKQIEADAVVKDLVEAELASSVAMSGMNADEKTILKAQVQTDFFAYKNVGSLATLSEVAEPLGADDDSDQQIEEDYVLVDFPSVR